VAIWGGRPGGGGRAEWEETGGTKKYLPGVAFNKHGRGTRRGKKGDSEDSLNAKPRNMLG